MPNYKETTVDGSRWQRCRTVTINNPLNGIAEAWFQEEEVISFGSNIFKRDVSNVKIDFDPATEITLLDPETGAPTGSTITHAVLYQALYSAYLAAATARDLELISQE